MRLRSGASDKRKRQPANAGVAACLDFAFCFSFGLDLIATHFGLGFFSTFVLHVDDFCFDPHAGASTIFSDVTDNRSGLQPASKSRAIRSASLKHRLRFFAEPIIANLLQDYVAAKALHNASALASDATTLTIPTKTRPDKPY